VQSSAHIQIVGGDNCIPVAQQKWAPIKVGGRLGIRVGGGGGVVIQKFG